MKDKSKRLTVVNTGKKPAEKKEVQQIVVQPSSSSSSHAPGFNPNLYLLKSVWDSVFEIKTDGSGQKYIFGKLPVVTKYGITMYADDGNVEIPQLAEIEENNEIQGALFARRRFNGGHKVNEM